MTHRRSAPGSDAQEEMTVIVLKLKGASGTLQKGFDTLSQAINALGPGTVTRQVRQLPSGNGQVIEAEATTEDPSLEELPPDPSTPAKAKRPANTPRYKFLDEFNLSPSGVPSLKDYCTEKNPQTENEKTLAVSAWIQTHGGCESFTVGHVFTCLRFMEWKTPADLGQRLRNLKSKKSYYVNPSPKEWKLSSAGLDAVDNIGKK